MNQYEKLKEDKLIARAFVYGLIIGVFLLAAAVGLMRVACFF